MILSLNCVLERENLNIERKWTIALLQKPHIVVVEFKFFTETLTYFFITCFNESYFLELTTLYSFYFFKSFFNFKTCLTSLFIYKILLFRSILSIDFNRFNGWIFVGIAYLSELSFFWRCFFFYQTFFTFGLR